ncbi:MAG: hypothetical protein K0S12_2447 [Bacteroidetes bacterium]|nr:hypothetical protein [Bacteroidota bacterium]
MLNVAAIREGNIDLFGFGMIGNETEPFFVIIVKRCVEFPALGDPLGMLKHERLQKQQAALVRFA